MYNEILDKYVDGHLIREVHGGSYFSDNGFKVEKYYNKFRDTNKLLILFQLWSRDDEYAIRIADERNEHIYFIVWYYTINDFCDIFNNYNCDDYNNTDRIITELLRIVKYKKYFGVKYDLK